jgi:hypothetical protein
MIDTSGFKVSKTNSKFSLASEISKHYNQDLTAMMLGFIKRKGEIAVRDEFIQSQKRGESVAYFIGRLKNIKIIYQ